MMKRVLLIGLAGAMGAITRVLIGEFLIIESGFPVATLIVNIVGTFLLCLIVTGAFRKYNPNKSIDIAVTSGFLGSFTTFSAISLETMLLVEGGQIFMAGLYVGMSIIGGIGAGMLGFYLGRRKAKK